MKYVDNLYEWAEEVYEEFCADSERVSEVHNYKTGITIVYDLRTGKSAFSKCRKDEEFSREIGVAVAYTRLKGREVPEVREKTLVKDLKVGDRFNLTNSIDGVYCIIGINPIKSNETVVVDVKTDRLYRFDFYREVYKIN